MKRTIFAIALALAAAPALALEVGPPYEQLVVDRALPQIPEKNPQYAEAAAAGATRSDASTGGEASTASPWANDFHFIAPPQ